MYISTISCYPNHKSREVAQTFVQAMSKYPDDPEVMENIIPAATKATRDGIEVYSFSRVKPGKADRALEITINRMGEFLGIEGFRYNITPMNSVEEAFKLVGM